MHLPVDAYHVYTGRCFFWMQEYFLVSICICFSQHVQYTSCNLLLLILFSSSHKQEGAVDEVFQDHYEAEQSSPEALQWSLEALRVVHASVRAAKTATANKSALAGTMRLAAASGNDAAKPR